MRYQETAPHVVLKTLANNMLIFFSPQGNKHDVLCDQMFRDCSLSVVCINVLIVNKNVALNSTLEFS